MEDENLKYVLLIISRLYYVGGCPTFHLSQVPHWILTIRGERTLSIVLILKKINWHLPFLKTQEMHLPSKQLEHEFLCKWVEGSLSVHFRAAANWTKIIAPIPTYCRWLVNKTENTIRNNSLFLKWDDEHLVWCNIDLDTRLHRVSHIELKNSILLHTVAKQWFWM